MLYLKNKMNIADIFIILLTIIFTGLDMIIDDNTASAVFRIRGIFRLLRVVLLIRKLDEFKETRKAKQKNEIDYTDFKSPLERTLEILTVIRDNIEEQRYVKDINCCIKNISNGKLYDMEMSEPETLGINSLGRSRRGAILAMEENLWIRSCSTMSNNKRLSRMSSMIVVMNRKSSTLQSNLNITEKAKQIFEKVDTLDFDIFNFKTEVKDNELVTLSNMLFEKHNMFKTCKISKQKFLNFTKNVQEGYKKVQYHNQTHGTDVAQTIYFFLIKGDWMKKGKMDNLDLLSMTVGGCCHDFEHPGFNANFLIKTNDRLAIRYNDISVLENHHVAATYELLSKTENNIFEKFSKDDKQLVRKTMVEMILSTDMSKHFADLGKFKSRVVADNFDPADTDKQLCMNMAMHIADISNPSKPWDISFKWTEWLYEEFFAQGDKERELGMPISDLMDRTTINIAKSSMGFIDVIVEPAYKSFAKFLPHIQENIDNIAANKDKWSSLVGEYQEKVIKALEYFEANPPQVLVEEDGDEENSEDESSPRIKTPSRKSGPNIDNERDSSGLNSLLSNTVNANSKTSPKDRRLEDSY